MSASFTLLACIRAQGPATPLAGDTLSLPVYVYEALGHTRAISRGDQLYVAHREADPADPGFAVGAVRELELTEALPPHGSLLFTGGRPVGIRCWYCPVSRSSSVEMVP